MADEECDLDTLTAILDEDSNDFPSENTPVSACLPKPEEKDDECDIETLTSFLEQESDKEKSKPENKNKTANEELSAEDIQAFLNESESESENEEVKENEIEEKESCKRKKNDVISHQSNNTEDNNKKLQAELLLMQKKMKELEEQLKASKQKETENTNIFFGEDNIVKKDKQCKSPGRSASVTPEVRKQMEKTIFGDEDDDDSDWDDLEGEKNGLSKEGRELKNLINAGEKKREAHKPFSGYSDYKSSETWKSQASQQQPKPTVTSRTEQPAKLPKQDDDGKFILEKNSGIRIINPRISSTVLEMKMEGRKFLKISKLHQKVKTPEIQGNWVTFGIVVNKTDPKTASSGKTFCIWKLNDLDDCDRTVSFFLFGQVYKEHWKNSVGTVIGLLNPNMMDNADKAPAEVAFTINHPNQLLLMGQSKDLGWCMGRTKKGNTCINFVNTKFGGFCSFHVQSAYKKASSQRSEFQGSMTGVTPKSFEKKIFPKGSHYIYGGKTYSTMEQKSNVKKKQDQLTVSKLMSQQLHSGKQKVTTMSIHDLKPDENHNLQKQIISNSEQSFLELVTTPSAGSLNLVKHLVKTEIKKEEEKLEKPVQSITPKELLQQHRKKMLAKKTERLASLGRKDTAPPPTDPLSATPTLGRGFYPGQDVFLDTSSKPMAKNGIDKAKLLAIAKIKQIGGCKKENPNAVKKKSPGQDRIKKRVLENLGSNIDGEANSPVEPPKKRSKLLGNVDINSAEVQKLLKAKSSHMGAYREAESDREEKYFDMLEKKESMEEKMKSITEMSCVVFTCQQCKYSAMSLATRCKEERHTVTTTKAKKRFFECKKCKQRTVDFNKLPTHPCRNCGEYCFERTSMYKEKTGPKLESEKLCIRGDEIKYLNSMNEKVYL